MTGRKLLLADDSVTIQKVIDLTFSDEGMEVTTVGDGRQAIEKLQESTPDIVLADVLMPGPNGYELCELIKQNDRYREIPVILLVGSFEPFDEEEARRVGADDVLTKPFQSIRQLVGRVGSLLGGKPASQPSTGEFSTLGLAQAPAPPHTSARQETIETAPLAAKPEEGDIEFQTADTLRLWPVEAVAAGPAAPLYNNFEAQPGNTLTANETSVVSKDFDNALLDLDDFESIGHLPEVEDSILDLEYVGSEGFAARSVEASQTSLEAESARQTDSPVAQEYDLVLEPVSQAAGSQWSIAEGRTTVAEVAEPATAEPIADIESPARGMAATGLSPEAVEAIAQRVVEKLSDKAVREIAWEVVPELAELLIKQHLKEQDRER